MKLRTCVDPSGKFIYGVHTSRFQAHNLRENDYIKPVGWLEDGTPVDNTANFPAGQVEEVNADTVYEIPNPFPFK